MGSASQPRPAAFRVLADDVDRRVDRVVRKLLPHVPLSRLYRALRAGDIRVNGVRVAPAARTREEDLISVSGALAATRATHRAPPATPLRPARRSPLAILYRDRHVVVVDKPAGLAVHGSADSVMARLAAVLPKRPAALSFAPAPVHQLDRITSGALVVARTLAAARRWATALRIGATVKLYLAVVAGELHAPAGGVLWEDTLRYDRRRRCAVADPAGAYAGARVWALAAAAGAPPCTLLLVHLHTGRRHQIRAQAALRGHPLLGDARYGLRWSVADLTELARRPGSRSGDAAGRPLLHAAAIRNDLPDRHDLRHRDALPDSDDLQGHAPPILAPLPAPARRSLEQRFGRGTAQRAAAAVAARIRATPRRDVPVLPALVAERPSDAPPDGCAPRRTARPGLPGREPRG